VILEEIGELITDEISTKYKKWNLLSKKLCRIEEIQEISSKELENLV
jgi:hypothetical protein